MSPLPPPQKKLKVSETTDVSNDVNGGPSGVGVASAAGKAMFWDVMKVLMIPTALYLLTAHIGPLYYQSDRIRRRICFH